MLGGIFISYRRDDSGGYAGRIFDRLTTRLGHENVFYDVDAIPPGPRFRRGSLRARGQVRRIARRHRQALDFEP